VIYIKVTYLIFMDITNMSRKNIKAKGKHFAPFYYSVFLRKLGILRL
jgi:hypothetical protein